MDVSFLKSFIEKFNKDKEEFNKRFEDINRRMDSIDRKFDDFDEKMNAIEARYKGIEDIFEQLGDFSSKMEDISIYLSQLDTSINQYKTMTMSGRRIHNGEIYVLKVKLQKVRPIVNWENDETLNNKFRQIESNFKELEGSLNEVVV